MVDRGLRNRYADVLQLMADAAEPAALAVGGVFPELSFRIEALRFAASELLNTTYDQAQVEVVVALIESADTVELPAAVQRLKVSKIVSDPPIPNVVTHESLANVDMPGLKTTVDGSLAVSVPLQEQPVDGFVSLLVNGLDISIGSSSKASPAYFSGDGGLTARSLTAVGGVRVGDYLYWNGTIATYQLAPSDKLTFKYRVK